MNNDITRLLNLEDENITAKIVEVKNSTKVVEISRPPSIEFCPTCGYRMYSKGIRTRKAKHQIIQDGFSLVLKIKQRRWQCTNPTCKEIKNDNFSFVSPRKRTTDLQDMLIVESFRDFNLSAAAIARRFNVSDSYALNLFDRYVSLDRLPLSEAISIDEVHFNMRECRYALVILDFVRGEPIDILPSRTGKTTEQYFAKIPIRERLKVRYLVTDMYTPYINFVNTYFPNATSVIDSFHVIQALNKDIDAYRKEVLKELIARDENRRIEKEAELHRKIPRRQSSEVYLLKHHKWVLLSNPENINYSYQKARWDKHFKCLMDAYDYEARFFEIDPNFEEIRRLKDMYHTFNMLCIGDPNRAGKELDNLIFQYKRSELKMFRKFAKLLSKHKDSVVASFNMILSNGTNKRLSNGPIESFNRIPKDMKRTARGYGNFDHIRNRILFATRTDAPILGIPKKSK